MTQTPFNPFEHHHPHHHDEEELAIDLLDPAQQSLNDALRVSFGFLKIAMLVVVVAYFFSGIFIVEENEQAVRLRFGGIVGEGDERFLQKGIHFGWPFPIEEVIKMPRQVQTVDIDTQFTFEMREDEAGLTLEQRAERRGMQPLKPEVDGSLITGDVNIVHGQWKLTYQITEPDRYIANVGNLEVAREVVRTAAEQAIVETVAVSKADDLLGSRGNSLAMIRAETQKALDAMESGLTVANVTGTVTVPLQVRKAKAAIDTANNEHAQAVQAARKKRDEMLGGAAGQAWQPLWKMVQVYEAARVAGDEQAVAAAQADLDAAFANLNTGAEYGNVRIGGEVSQIVNEARAYRISVLERTRAEAAHFATMYEKYRENPAVFVQARYTEMISQVLGPDNDVEVYYTQDKGQIRLIIDRDPRIQKARDEKEFKERTERLQRESQEAAKQR